MSGPLEWVLVGGTACCVMSRWVGEESRAGRTGNSAERGLEWEQWRKVLLSYRAITTFCCTQRAVSVDPRHWKYSLPDCLDLAQSVFGSQSLPLAHAFFICPTSTPRSEFSLYRASGRKERANWGWKPLGPGSNCTVMLSLIVNPASIGVYYVLSTALRLVIKQNNLCY